MPADTKTSTMTLTTADRAPARLRSSNRVRDILRTGRRRAVGTVALHVAPGPSGTFRFTAVASRRVGSAVTRNRAKRLLREATRSLPWVLGTDAVVVARSSMAGAQLATVRDDLRAAGTALGVIA